MRISQLIAELAHLQLQFGDIPCTVLDPDGLDDGNLSPAFIALEADDLNQVESIIFVDRETALAFVDSEFE